MKMKFHTCMKMISRVAYWCVCVCGGGGGGGGGVLSLTIKFRPQHLWRTIQDFNHVSVEKRVLSLRNGLKLSTKHQVRLESSAMKP